MPIIGLARPLLLWISALQLSKLAIEPIQYNSYNYD